MSKKEYVNIEKAISILRLRSQQLAGMYGDLGGAASGAALLLGKLADEEAEDVKPVVRGKWEFWAGGLPKCPVCGHEYVDHIECDNFCGNCGADMRNKTPYTCPKEADDV